MYSSGIAIHEAVQHLFVSNPGRFEKEKYVEYGEIVGSIWHADPTIYKERDKLFFGRNVSRNKQPERITAKRSG